MDLICFNCFSVFDYLWFWKGGVVDGISIVEMRNLFFILFNDILVNLNLKQNVGY